MADGSRPRAVSGEIMTDLPEDAGGRARPVGDFIDAEYITLPAEDPPSGHPRAESGRSSPKSPEPAISIGSPSSPVGGMSILRRRAFPMAPRRADRGGPLFWAAGIGLAAAAFWISGGHALLRDAPFVGVDMQSALRISGVTSRVDASGAKPILLVDGEAANDGASVEHLPTLAIAVAGNDGRVTRYRLGTSGRPLAPGETFAFSSRLDVPKNGVKTVSVAFAE